MRTFFSIALFTSSVLAGQLISDHLRAHAQARPQRHCVWTYIEDSGEPNIGEDGRIDFSKGPNWKKVSDEGWELKAVKANSYIFERCDP